MTKHTHKWSRPRPNRAGYPERVCSKCGATQTKTDGYWRISVPGPAKRS